MSLDKYKLPLCLTEGVVITLDDAPEVKITVAMPISSNRKFAFGWAKRLPMTQDGKFEANPFDVMEAQRAELIESCILKIEGVDNQDTFFKDYPLVIEELWSKVQELLPTYEQRLEDEAKKLISALQWFLQWSGKEKFYDVLEKQGKVKEEHKKPNLSSGEELILSIFFDLSNSRQMGMAIGHIPINVIWGATERYKFPETVIEVIKQLDNKFVEYHGKSN